MEWVEVQGKTIDLAVEVAIGELGVASRDDVTVEVIQEPKAGFLGMGGQEAIVKVTRGPRKRRRSRGRGRNGSPSDSTASGQPSPSRSAASKPARNGGSNTQTRGRSGGSKRQEATMEDNKNSNDRPPRDDRPDQAPIEEQAEVAKAFVEGLVEAFGLEGTVTTRIEEDVLYLDVAGAQTEALVGPKGSVMHSVLELTRTVVQRKTYGAPRMRIDIAGYGERRREALQIYAAKLAAQVIEDKSEVMLEAMNAADRKVLHDAVAEIDGVRSYSEGDEPRRAVVIAYDGD
ncbi:MAG TPA: RNA-binding cell elongation regulator Jag/EloR [Acidimicrobiia bacterium]|nr:RNA-binding cell elongation regulator Jag/EloR [Acidimicrobiia bacterium]